MEEDDHQQNQSNSGTNSSQTMDETTQSLIEEISPKSFRASPNWHYHQHFNGQSQGERSNYLPSDSVSTFQSNERQNIPINSKHFNVQCYRGTIMENDSLETSHSLIHPKSIAIEWVFDDCITQRYIHKMLKKCIGERNFSDVEFRLSNECSNDFLCDGIKQERSTLTISENACFLIPSIACKIEEGKIQTIELQIPFCFHFAIDYPEDIPSLLTSYNQKVTMEGCVVFSSQVFVQIFEWCEHYSNHKEFIQIDLEGKGMMFCCNSESYFKSIIGEWNWDFLQSMDKNLLLQTLIMSHILTITPLLLMIKTKIMFDVRQKCKQAASNQPSQASTKVQFLNYFVQDPSKCQSLINSPTIHSTNSPIPHRRHARSSSYDKIRGLTSNSTKPASRNSPALSNNQKSIQTEEKVLATLGDSEKGLIHFMRIR